MGTAPESRDSIPKTEKLLRALCMSSFKAQEISASRQPSLALVPHASSLMPHPSSQAQTEQGQTQAPGRSNRGPPCIASNLRLGLQWQHTVLHTSTHSQTSLFSHPRRLTRSFGQQDSGNSILPSKVHPSKAPLWPPCSSGWLHVAFS
ncbi:hypothetical protein THAR02_10241 [Trichoderma harzianum]|uniref:Uncharacterized protein n=1 Tax=Trichoderma harzianum TaxID=5544 RepID=A0A0F9WWY4_TRIHA|nr:hypothetical protein THAR02_10241 [Trichoderma harzianum]